ncbi:MAG: PepSY-associated TM helix domain-containing protein [Vicinamibacterales bacterium]
MKLFRTVLFWLHLVTGVVAGVVILVMCVTGVVLTYEKQMLEWADRRSLSVPLPAEARPLPPETLLAAAVAEAGAAPTGITMRADPRAPATVSFEGGRARLIDPYTGGVLGEPSPRLRGFFRSMTSWHRWLALEGTSRGTGKAITGAANLGFLFIVLSGMYLWLPKVRTWLQFTQVLWFRGGLSAKARDFNWHNVIGIWSAVPLAIVVAGAVPISYGWAGSLVYRLAGEAPPQAAARPGSPGGPGASGPARGGRDDEPSRPWAIAGLDMAWASARGAVPNWRSASVRLGGPATAPFVISLDEGYGGQPQWRTTVTLDRASGAMIARESFDNLGPGRRLRSWLRFAHTGEIYGLPGQTVAGLVSAGGAVLVYTGIALALRRWWAWMRRRPPAEVRKAA